MKQFSRYDHYTRKRIGLPEFATEEDYQNSVETSGVPTDFFKALAEKVFRVEYAFVTPLQRENAKRLHMRGVV